MPKPIKEITEAGSAYAAAQFKTSTPPAVAMAGAESGFYLGNLLALASMAEAALGDLEKGNVSRAEGVLRMALKQCPASELHTEGKR